MTTDYEMWLTWGNEQNKFRIRPLPEKIEIDFGSAHQTVEIIGTGKIAIPAERDIMSVKFSSFFPAAGYTGVDDNDIRNPQTLINILNILMYQKKPVRFIFTGCHINFMAMFKIKYNEVGGDVGTKHYTMELYRYEQPRIRQIKTKNNANVISSSGNRVDNSSSVRTYTVQKGDYLIKIARKLLGDSSRYKEIVKLNSNLIKNPDYIQVGWVLKIPEK